MSFPIQHKYPTTRAVHHHLLVYVHAGGLLEHDWLVHSSI